MAGNYHVNAQGNPGLCRAQKGGCPFGAEDAHHATPEAAKAAFEASMASETVAAPVKKASKAELPDERYSTEEDYKEEMSSNLHNAGLLAEDFHIYEVKQGDMDGIPVVEAKAFSYNHAETPTVKLFGTLPEFLQKSAIPTYSSEDKLVAVTRTRPKEAPVVVGVFDSQERADRYMIAAGLSVDGGVFQTQSVPESDHAYQGETYTVLEEDNEAQTARIARVFYDKDEADLWAHEEADGNAERGISFTVEQASHSLEDSVKDFDLNDFSIMGENVHLHFEDEAIHFHDED